MIKKLIEYLNIKKLPIKSQLIITILFVSLIGLLISMGFGIYYSIKTFKTALIKNSLLEANLIGQYCISPLIFEDKRGADNILKNIRTIPTIKGAVLYNKKGNIFSFYSKYANNTKEKIKEKINKIDFNGKEYLLINNEMFVKKSIHFNKERRGAILLIISTESLSARIIKLILNNMLVFIIVLFIIYLITMKIQKILTEPILNLANISKEISKSKEFSFDSTIFKRGETVENEIDILYSSFRDMIEQIEQRQKKLNMAIVALKESEEKYRRFFEQDVSAIFVASSEGEIIDYNSTFEKLFGYNTKESQQRVTFKNLCKNKETYNIILKKLNKTGKITNEEIIMVTKHGKEIITLANIFLEKENEKEKNYIIAYLFDITKRKQFEEQFLHSQKMGSIGTFAGGIAHDFNNILTVIKGYSDIILNKIKPEEGVVYKNISVIKQSSEKAENLIKKLLLLSKKGISQPTIFNINDTINDLNKILTRLIGENIHLKTELSENLPYIKADQNQIEQVFINLVANARDALNECKKQNKEIIIKTFYRIVEQNYNEKTELLTAGEYVGFSIRDNGIGMEEKTKNKVFEPFFTTKEKGRGTGLGLSTVYGIVKQHNGVIYLYSEKKIGTTIKIYFPAIYLKDKDNMKKGKNKKDEHKHQKGKTILVVEDDSEVRNYAITVLKDLGYNVLFAENGEEAFDLIKKVNGVDLILTDVIMPKMNGKEFISKVKKIFPDIKVVFTSGYTNGYLVNEGGIQDGINFLSKPYSYDSLSKIISEVIKD